jgi:hypothetical protein
MFKKILAALALTAAAVVPTAFVPAPASAAWGTDVTHASDDSGWASPIRIQCNDGKYLNLGRGQSSAFGAGSACTLSGVAVIVVPAGHTVYCKNALPPYQNRYYYVGRTEVPSAASLKCYDQQAL